MNENKIRSKYFLKRVESVMTEGVKLLENILLGKMY